jgi:hypothetical protein
MDTGRMGRPGGSEDDMRNKGYTVHLDNNGRSACGVTARGFMGQPGISTDINRVTCRKCERLAMAAEPRCAQCNTGTEIHASGCPLAADGQPVTVLGVRS